MGRGNLTLRVGYLYGSYLLYNMVYNFVKFLYMTMSLFICLIQPIKILSAEKNK